MATITRYVNTASTPGGDGTTNATAGANRAYASANEWEAAEQTDLDTANNIMDCLCEGVTADTTAVIISGWTTSATDYIRIRTTQANRHDGKWNTSKYRLEMTSTSAIPLRAQVPYIRIEGIQAAVANSPDSGRSGIYCYGGDYVQVSHCIVRGKSGVAGWGIYIPTEIGPVRIWNNIIYDWDGSGGQGIHAETSGATKAYCYNNTIIDCEIGMLTAGGNDIIAKNNIVQGSTTGYSGTFDGNSTNNLSDHDDSPGSNPQNSKTLTFADAANDDFHLDSGDSDAIDQGVDLSADANLAFSDDIDGDARSGTWDIGADEFVAAGGAIIPIFDHHYRQMGA